MWKPRLIALDLDGTVIARDQSIPSDVIEAIRDAVDAGVRVVLSTGRGWFATRPVVEFLDLPEGPHVCSNGALLVEYPPFEIIHEITFDARPAVEKVLAMHPDIHVAVESVGVGYLVNKPFPPGELAGRIEVVDIERLVRDPVVRVIVRDPGGTDDSFVEMAHHLGLEGVSYSIGYSAWLDIAPAGVNKAMGLASVCARLGINQADVLAIGDGRNDIEMLEWAGRGVAMGDAPAVVQLAADHVTGKFEDGGTAEELRRWV